MSLTRWKLSLASIEKDKNRWLLRLKIDERELMALISTITGTVGRPFLLEKDDYDFGLYIYESNEEAIKALAAELKNKCPDGIIEQPSKDEDLSSMLDKVARGLDNVVTDKETAELRRLHENTAEPPHEAAHLRPSEEISSSSTKIVYSGSDGREGFLDLELNPRYTFEEFVIGPNNRFTAAAAQAVADNPGKIYNPFYIYGGVGLGKTHMMNAVGHYVRKKTPSARVLYVTTEKFMGEVIDSIRSGQLQRMRDHYRNIDLLLVDDIQFLVESESTQEEFFHTFNVLHQSGKQIIVTSDRPPKHLTTLEDRLRSRFEWGLIADIKSPNLETRVAILKKKEEVEKLRLNDNILLYIASKLKSNIRELEGFLKRINAYAALTHQEVDMDLVHSLMADLLPVEETEEATSQQAIYQSTASEPVMPSAIPTSVPVQQSKPSEPKPQEPQAQELKPPEPRSSEPVNVETKIEPEQLVIIQQSKPAATKPAAPQNRDASESNLKSVDVAFFYPEGKDEELRKIKEHFRDVIKKHKLKFRLEGIFEHAYAFTGKINYAFFTELCKTNNVGIAIVLGPPMESAAEAEDFANLLSTVMDDEKVSLQLVPWVELNKDYRYLNLALDITLLKHKS